MQTLLQFCDLAILRFECSIDFLGPRVHAAAPPRASLPKPGMAFEARSLRVEPAVESRDTLLNHSQFPLQAVLQVNDELFQVFHAVFTISWHVVVRYISRRFSRDLVTVTSSA